jgi:hypothetical protein
MLTAAFEIAPLFVCTSKPTAFAPRVVEHFGLRSYFAGIYGSEFDGVRSDKGDLIAWLLEHERLVGRRLTMVGDREHDMRAARQHVRSACCGVTVRPVSWNVPERPRCYTLPPRSSRRSVHIAESSSFSFRIACPLYARPDDGWRTRSVAPRLQRHSPGKVCTRKRTPEAMR